MATACWKLKYQPVANWIEKWAHNLNSELRRAYEKKKRVKNSENQRTSNWIERNMTEIDNKNEKSLREIHQGIVLLDVVRCSQEQRTDVIHSSYSREARTYQFQVKSRFCVISFSCFNAEPLSNCERATTLRNWETGKILICSISSKFEKSF